jgi:hypothetical protein
MKTPYLSQRFKCKSILDGLNLVFIHLDILCSYNISKKHNFLHVKSTLLIFNIQSLIMQYTTNITQMIKMLIYVLVIDQDVIKIHNPSLFINACNTWFISLINILVLFVSPNIITNHSNKIMLSLKCSFSFILFFHHNLMVLTFQINFRENIWSI